MVDIDERFYYKKEALRGLKMPIGKIFFKLKVFDFYLDYQVWRTHFNKWHPFTWIIFVGAILFYGIRDIKEIKEDMFVPKEKRKYPYKNAK